MARHPLFAERRAEPLVLTDLAFGTAGPVTLRLPAPGIVCLLGPAEAGAHLLAAAERRLRDLGRRTAHPGPGRRWPRARLVADILDETLARHGAAAWRATARPVLLDAFGLDGAADAHTLGAGPDLLLRLACAAAGAPDVLLLPDLLAPLHDPGRVRAAALRLGLSILHATMRREDAFLLADDAVLLAPDRVLQTGSPALLYERPASLEAALVAGPGTVLDGTLRDCANDVAVVALDSGPVVEATPAAGIDEDTQAGTPCRVLLRPERVAVAPLAAGALGDQAVAGVLVEMRHLGPAVRLLVAIGDAVAVEVLRPSFAPLAGLAPGRNVSLAWQSRHALVFAA